MIIKPLRFAPVWDWCTYFPAVRSQNTSVWRQDISEQTCRKQKASKLPRRHLISEVQVSANQTTADAEEEIFFFLVILSRGGGGGGGTWCCTRLR